MPNVSTSDENPVNKVFKKECPIDYEAFNSNRQLFINLLSNPSAIRLNMHEKIGQINLLEKIDENFTKCVTTITKSYTVEIEVNFVDPINKYYAGRQTGIYGSCPEINSLFNNRIKSLSIGNNSPVNIRKIKETMNDYINFEQECIIRKLHRMQRSFIHGSTCFDNRHNFITPNNYNILKKYFTTTINGKSCYEKKEEFKKFSVNTIFKNFINLPKSDCTNTNSLQNSNNKACQNIVKKLKPEYPKEENKENLFYKCNEEVNKAYEECFGKKGERNDLQEILYLINIESTAVCEDNKIGRAYTAEKNCLNSINDCIDECHKQIENFKTEFLQCFFLPDFKTETYQQLHGKNQCATRINDLSRSFEDQAKEEPFQAEGKFSSLQNNSNQKSSIAHLITRACENPLEKNQIEKKIHKMRQICQEQNRSQSQNPNSRIQGTIPTAAGSNSFNSKGSTGSSSNKETSSQRFSYDKGSNEGFQFNNNSKNQEQDSELEIGSSLLLPDNQGRKRAKTSDSDKTDSDETVDWTDEKNPSEEHAPFISENSKTDSQEQTEGMESELADEKLSSEEATKESEKLKSKINTQVRRFLSSDAKYGSANPYPGSATRGFFNWVRNKTNKAKKTVLNSYDKMGGINRAEFQRRLKLNNQNTSLFELQREMFIKACEEHNCH